VEDHHQRHCEDWNCWPENLLRNPTEFHRSDQKYAVMTVEPQRPYLASYCMIRANDTILVQRRFNTGYLDGQWALPSGHAIDGEDALAAASRELLEETGLIVKLDDWQFVCAMHRRTDRSIIDLFFATAKFFGTPRICEPTKCDGLAFFPMNALPQPLADYIGVALDCLKGISPRHGSYYSEGWS
jgi:8-oxo-dGTP diphosphatase